MGIVQEQVAPITGGGRGIGRETRQVIASEGATVAVNAIGGDTTG